MKRLTGAGIVALAFAMLTGSTLTEAADHLDAPALTPPGGDVRLDINDVYAFQSPTAPDNVVLIMTVHPLANAASTFHPDASYDFAVDTDGDARPDASYRVTFSPPGAGGQDLLLRRVPAGPGGAVLARGRTGSDVSVRGGGTVRAGLFDDPFFFDLDAFRGVGGRSFCDGNQRDFFLGLNVLAIVLEIPASSFPVKDIGVWSETRLQDQVDRMGRPAINTVFIPANPFEPSEPSQKNAFNEGKPRHDQRDFRAEVVDTLRLFYGDDPTVEALADILLPDILTFDTSSSAGFLNGRRLEDDVIDAELALVTNGIVTSDCVDNDSSFGTVFPYLAPAN